jgi:hypothetical protein
MSKETPHILTDWEIIRRIEYAGYKKVKQLLTKLIKRYGGKPILHLTNKKCSLSHEYGLQYEVSYKEIFGFTVCESCYGSAEVTCNSISGNFPKDIIYGIVSALMSNDNIRNRMFTK